MDEGKISVRYARALFDMVEQKGLQKDTYEKLEQLSNAFIELPELSKSLSNPMHKQAEKLDLLIAASGCSKDSQLAHFFQFVLDKGREAFMVFISMSYQKIYREMERLVLGNIISATPLQPGSVEKIRALVDAKFKASIELTTQVDTTILGGFILEVDNYRMDSSVQTALKHLQAKLLQA